MSLPPAPNSCQLGSDDHWSSTSKNHLQVTNSDFQSGPSGIALNAGGNDWCMQQNWQKQLQEPFNKQLPNLIDNMSNSTLLTSTQFAMPSQSVNNNVESNLGEGWGDWDDWNQNEIKSVQAGVNNQCDFKTIQDVVEDSFKSSGNWSWQNSPHSQVLESPHVQVPTIPTVPLVKMSSSTLPSLAPPAMQPLPMHSNAPSIGSLEGQEQYSTTGRHFSNLVPSLEPSVDKNPSNLSRYKETAIPENNVTLDLSRNSIDESYLTPAPLMFQNERHENDEAINQSKSSTLSVIPQNSKVMAKGTSNVHRVTMGAKPLTKPSDTDSEMMQPSLTFPANTSDFFGDREMFLNQENNERNQLLSHPGRLENLLPPPAAYQQQSTVTDDRNQYLQTSHLSEDDFVLLNNPSNDDDVNLPPPGLARFVLGEPEQMADSERHADGEDDTVEAANRNVYLFTNPIDIQVQRVVTGVESLTISQPPVITLSQQIESREIDLDGENLEDQHQVNKAAREEPMIGGDTINEPIKDISSSLNVLEVKDLSRSSTENESDHPTRRDSKNYPTRSGKGRKRYESDESEGSSDCERPKGKDKKRKDKMRDSDNDSTRQKNSKKREDKFRKNNRCDDSRYETEESTRYERSGKRHDRKESDRKYNDDIKRGSNNRSSYRKEGRRERRSDHELKERTNREKNYQDENRDIRRRSDQKYRNYDDSYQHYSRKGNNSRNARDSDFEKESRYRRYNMYSGFDYDPYAYYHQHQQYFEQLRRTNPQSYAEWYRKYYSQMQGDAISGADGRESVHSGRSSAAGQDKDRQENMENVEGRSIPLVSHQAEDDLQAGRTTPYKFSNDHTVVSLISGVLVCVKPKYSHNNGLQNIVKLIKVSPNDSTKKLFQSFPGPLVKGITHKKTVIEYCEERIKSGPITSCRPRSYQSSSNSLQSVGFQQTLQSSYVLLWNLLVLLLRQNGVVVGTDIAELLVKNQKLFPYETQSKRNSITSIEHNLKESIESNTSEIEEGDVRENIGVFVDSSDEKSQLNDDEITDKFRNYLLYGNVKEALEWATDNNLWGHALFLASKVDRRLHANVMMKFANKLKLNDPLQTLYQLMSGRCPSSVTGIQDEKWGDWRPHLAMIISNTTQSPDLNRKAITSLGDSLLNRGDLFAAQFCFLMAQVGFGKYSSATNPSTNNNMARLVLLGSSHIKSNSFSEFASNEAIIMTEIYEYACSLNDESFSVVEFQPYKFLLSCRLLDYGFPLKALMYLEQIAVNIQKNPLRYEASFIEKLYELANQLKFHDPVMEKTFTGSEEGPFEEQEWLRNLKSLYESNQVSTQSQCNQDPLIYMEHSKQQPVYDFNGYPQTTNKDVIYQPQDIIQSDNKYAQDILQDFTTSSEIPETESHSYFLQTSKQADIQQEQLSNQHPHRAQEPHQPEEIRTGISDAYDFYSQNVSSQFNEPSEIPSISMPNSGSAPKRSIFDDENHGTAPQHQNLQPQETQIDNKTIPHQQHRPGISSSQNSGWFGGIWNKFSGKPKNQMILPDDKNPTIVWDAEKKKWINTDEGEDSQDSFAPPPKMTDLITQLQKPQQHTIQQPQIIPSQDVTLQSGNPITISNPMAPIQVAENSAHTQPSKSSGLQSNMFKIQRNRTLKKSYVDVFNPSGANTKNSENIMAPSLPPLPQSGYMIPSDGSTSQNQQGTSQFYDPNTFAGNFQH